MTAGLLVAAAMAVLAFGRRPPPSRGRAVRSGHAGHAGHARHADQSGRLRRSRRTPRPSASDWARYLDLVAAAVRGGTSIRVAAAEALSEVPLQGDAVRTPLDLDDLDHRPVHHADEAVVVHALVTATRLGGATAATVQTGANLLRERAAVRAEAGAHAAQARLSARVLTVVPLGFATWSAIASQAFRRAVTTPAGLASAALGVAANIVGWWWMRRIVRQAVA